MSTRERWIRRGVSVVVFGACALLFANQGSLAEAQQEIKSLSHAKQIYLGLRLYSGDHNGSFPNYREDGSPIKSSNEAFRALIPDYFRTEKVFYSPDSAWTPKEPDDEMEGSNKLAAGENAFAYVSNLSETLSPEFPLVASGFAEGTPGIYSSDPKAKGGFSEGASVITVRVDGSGKAEKFGMHDENLFKPAAGWLAPNQVPLNPE